MADYDDLTVAKNLLDTVISLPTEDRLELFRRLGESLRDEIGESSLPEEQQHLLDARPDDFERDPTNGTPWSEVEAQLRAMLAKP